MRYTSEASLTRARSSTGNVECSRSREALMITAPRRDVSSGTRNDGWHERKWSAASRKDNMLTRSPSAPATLSRRTQAQRRMRRAAPHRLFCSTNGCPTYLVPDETGRQAVCPVCGLQRSIAAGRSPRAATRAN